MNVNDATEAARSEIQKQFNITDVIIKSSVLKNDMWYIHTSFILNNEQKYYNVTINNITSTVEGMQETKFNTRNTGSAQTFMLVALIFASLTVVIYAIISVVFIFSSIAFINATSSGVTVSSFNPFSLIILAIFLPFLIVNVYILIRITKIRKFMNNGDYKSAYYEDSVLFGVLALLIGGIITGLMLLLARGELENAASN